MMDLFGEFYRGRRVLVTGHTGFKGGWLVAWLKALGAEVVGYSLDPAEEQTTFFRDARIGEDMTSLVGDVRDAAAFAQVVREHQPEVVFNLAAQSLVRRSYRSPVETYATNVMGTVHVLEAARLTASVRAVVIVTSDKCYENREWVWGYRETEPLGGHDPYSSSKGCAELVTAAYRNSFLSAPETARVASGRAGNVVGGGDWSEDRIVPDIVRAVTEGRPVQIRNPAAWRPWQHVLEPVRGYLMLGEQLATGADVAAGWNFGPVHDDTTTVLEIAQKIIAAWGSGDIEVDRSEHAPHEAHALTLDCSKARAQLDWVPALTLDETVALTVDWYRGHASDPDSAAALTWTQIERYAVRVRDLTHARGSSNMRSLSGNAEMAPVRPLVRNDFGRKVPR